MIIVKVGGSLFGSPLVQHWLDTLSQLSQDEAIIIVPGGGPFADQVRMAQQQHQFDDQHAHHMALLAMSQFGLMLLGLNQQAKPFYYPVGKSKITLPNLSVWLPDKRLLTDPQLAQNWDTTSDSLALWLAQQLNPNKLSLLKHQSQSQSQSSIHQLISQGLLDRAFSTQYAQGAVVIEVFDANQSAGFCLTQPKHPLMP